MLIKVLHYLVSDEIEKELSRPGYSEITWKQKQRLINLHHKKL